MTTSVSKHIDHTNWFANIYYQMLAMKKEVFDMDTQRHYVSGFFVNRTDAENIVSQIADHGIPRDRIHIYDKNSLMPDHIANDSDDKVLKDILIDSGIGAAVGTGVGALIEVGLIAANVTLFVASPLIAPLVLLGWGATLGGLIGATAGASEKIKPLSELVHDAITNDQYVVVVETFSNDEKVAASQVIKDAIGDSTDTAVV